MEGVSQRASELRRVALTLADFKIVMAPCRNDELISFYCFMPTHLSPHRKEGFRFESPPRSELLDPYNDVKLDPYIMRMLEKFV